jgi:hypothetical protein
VIGLWCIFGFTLTPDITLSHSRSRLPASLGASNDVRQNYLETSASPHQLGSRNKTGLDPGYWLSLTKDEVVQAIIVLRLCTSCGNTLYPSPVVPPSRHRSDPHLVYNTAHHHGAVATIRRSLGCPATPAHSRLPPRRREGRQKRAPRTQRTSTRGKRWHQHRSPGWIYFWKTLLR